MKGFLYWFSQLSSYLEVVPELVFTSYYIPLRDVFFEIDDLMLYALTIDMAVAGLSIHVRCNMPL